AALAGLAALFCIDRVYDPVRSGGPAHSADTVVTGALVAALLARAEPVATLLLALKAVLYMRRHALGESGTDRRSVETRLVLASFRVGAGLLVPLALLLTGSAISPEWLLAAVALGEAIDRAQFYGELRIRGPRDELEVSRVVPAVAASSGAK
ncbi:MAG TPA: hypothetical protein VNI57_05840, partial [Candidatus Saccharimonadales bacterium]|nr:hypothetical protein [Candidatus Saccharimonadales bacterium]